MDDLIESTEPGARRKPQWRHQALAGTLYRRISSGEFPLGTTLPTERDIAANEKVSRATVREALRFLENHGMIRRRQGSGTVVIACEPQQQVRMPINSLEALLTYPRETEVDVSAGAPLAADDPAIVQAELDPARDWYRFTFMRRLPDTPAPVSYIEVYLLTAFAGVEDDVKDDNGSVFELLEARFGIHPAEAIVRIDAVQVNDHRAEALGVPEGTAAVRIQRRYTDSDRQLYEVSVTYYPQDRYVFETVIRG